MPEFYIKIARKKFFPIFFVGGTFPPAPVSYAYAPFADFQIHHWPIVFEQRNANWLMM